MHTVSAQVPDHVYKRLKVFCAENDLRVSWIVRMALEDAAAMDDDKLRQHAVGGRGLAEKEST